MGICMSCNAAEAGGHRPTAKLILHDGVLREFPRPVKVSHVLGEEKHDLSAWFVCDADGMEFDGFISAVDELRLGQIYFVLPEAMLRQPLHADDLAALAVKASAALMRTVPPPKVGSGSFRKRSATPPQPLVFADVRPASPGSPKQLESPPLPRTRRRAASLKGRDIALSLITIPE